MEDLWRVRLTCEMGDYMEADWETCKRGHGLLYMTFDCACSSCYFHGKPAYSEDPEKVAASKEQVRVHFREVHQELTHIDVAGKVIEEQKTAEESDNIVKLTVEEVEFYASSIPNRETKSVTEDEAIEIGKKTMNRAEYDLWAAAEERKKQDALICPLCAKITSSNHGLRKHVLQVHKNLEKFECTLCEKSFCAKVSLRYHMKKKHQIGDTIKCDKCDSSFPDFNTYTIHRATHRDNTTVKCEECDSNIRKEKYSRHLKEVHGLESRFDPEMVSCKIYAHWCKECKSGYKRKEDLERHVQANHLKHDHPCAECGKRFKYKTSLRRHVRTDHKEKCLGSGINQDEKSKTGKEESSPEEEKVIETNSEFQIQGSYQTKESKFTCTQCFKILSTDYSLRRHIRQMHENKGRFECTLCQRSFSAKGSLEYHTRVKHTISEDSSLQCEKCKISCSDPQALEKHKKTHLENVKIKCHKCSLLLEKKSLAGHIVEVHNIEFRFDADKRNFPVYPYECTECGFVCKRKNDLERHYRAKHTLEEFVCKECGKKFSYVKTLKRHMKSSHASIVGT